MTVALAALVGLLAAALAMVVFRFVQSARRYEQRILEASEALEAVQSQLDETRAAAHGLQRRLTVGEGGAETAERVRLQREWAELAGPEAGLPVAWDATLASAVGTELEIIREVVGTPGTVEIDGDATSGGGFRLALAAEFLRAAAMDADEMQVRVSDCVVVNGSAGASAIPATTPHLGSIKPLMEGAGAELLIEHLDGGFKATLRFCD